MPKERLVGGLAPVWRWLLALTCLFLTPPGAAQPSSHALVLEMRGAIGPAAADYLKRGLAQARDSQAVLAIIEIDTPGGLDTSTRAIVREILGSPVPVATYVTPAGARAASAGTYILYASHIAAMAPGTNLGAATPVSIGGGGVPDGNEADTKDDASGQKGATAPRTASEAKAINDSVAFIRSLADLRQRNADWAEAAVREAASLPALAAVERKVVDFTARDLRELLAKANGRTVSANNATVVLRTDRLRLEHLGPDWRTRLLSTITDPNIALILMMIGIYGLLFEFMSPGAVIPGTVGAIAMLLALYALAILPVDYAGLALILLGIALMAGEAFSPSFGVLGIGGLAALVLGATMLFDTDVPGFTVSWSVIAGVAVASAGFGLLAAWLTLRSRRMPVTTGREDLIGAAAEVQDWRADRGHVFTRGERWRAISSERLAPGDTVRIAAIDGLTLTVELTAHAGEQGG